VKTVMRQAVPLQPMEVQIGADLHLQPVEDPMLEKVDVPNLAVTPWGAHTGAGSWWDLWTRGERSPGWSRFADRACDLVERIHVGTVPKELQPVGRTHTGEVHGGLSPMGGTPCWSSRRV